MHTRDYIRDALTAAHARAAADANDQAVSDITDLINGLEEDTPDTPDTPGGATAVPHYGDDVPGGRLGSPLVNPAGPRFPDSVPPEENQAPYGGFDRLHPAAYREGAQSWDELTVPVLEKAALEHDCHPEQGSGADGAVIKEDLIAALTETYEARATRENGDDA